MTEKTENYLICGTATGAISRGSLLLQNVKLVIEKTNYISLKNCKRHYIEGAVATSTEYKIGNMKLAMALYQETSECYGL